MNHDNVEIWVSQFNAKRKPGWRNSARAALKTVGVAANPPGWPRQPKPAGRTPAVAAYTPQQEAGFIDAAALPGFKNPEGHVVGLRAAAFGAGDERPRNRRRGNR